MFSKFWAPLRVAFCSSYTAMPHIVFVRIMYGARISLSVGFAAALLNLVIGVDYGLSDSDIKILSH